MIVLDFGFLSYFSLVFTVFPVYFCHHYNVGNGFSQPFFRIQFVPPSTYETVFFGTQSQSIEVGSACVRDYVNNNFSDKDPTM